MFETSSDILNMSLAIGFGILVIFLCVLIYYGIRILKDIVKVADDVKDISEKVRKSIVEPLKAFDFIVERTRPYVEMVLERKMNEQKKRSRKKK